MFQTIHPTLVIKSVPQFWHKGVGKANHVIETKKENKRKKRGKKTKRKEREKREKRNDMTQVRAQVVAKAPGGRRGGGVSELWF